MYPQAITRCPMAIVKIKVLHHGQAMAKATNTINTTISPKFLLGKCSSNLVTHCFYWRKLLSIFLFVPM
jgi:hypothetical protein